MTNSPSAAWDAFLTDNPEAHLLQTSAWGELKGAFGWSVQRLRTGDAGAQLLYRRLPLGLTLAYIPEGPIGSWLPDLLPALLDACRRRRTFALKIEPDALDDPALADTLRRHGFQASPHTIQPRRTLLVDLRESEDAILGRMHQKTRYNIGLASRRGVRVEPWGDVAAFGEMIQETADRDRFGAHTLAYYRRAFDLFHAAGMCQLLVARVEGIPVAALMAFARGSRAWYLYGASTDRERQRMPNHLLQWAAMRWARERGCTTYDLWGVPDVEQEDLEAQFAARADGLWGVYRFKRGFGGRLARTLGAWDFPLHRPLYAVYRWLLARRMAE